MLLKEIPVGDEQACLSEVVESGFNIIARLFITSRMVLFFCQPSGGFYFSFLK
jgi:hypothetical protein